MDRSGRVPQFPILGWISKRSKPFWNLDADKDRQLVPKVGLEPTRDILPPVFETGASTIPPLRPGDFSIARLRLSPVAL